MKNNPRCLYNSNFASFLNADINSIFGALCDNYHGDALTTKERLGNQKLK